MVATNQVNHDLSGLGSLRYFGEADKYGQSGPIYLMSVEIRIQSNLLGQNHILST